jgi:hypothetical protein
MPTWLGCRQKFNSPLRQVRAKEQNSTPTMKPLAGVR